MTCHPLTSLLLCVFRIAMDSKHHHRSFFYDEEKYRNKREAWIFMKRKKNTKILEKSCNDRMLVSILSTSHRTFDMPEGKFSFLLGLKILIPNSRFAPKEKMVLEKGMSRPWPFQKQQKFKSSHNDCGPQKSWLDGILLVAILISDRKFQDQSFACWNFITFLNGDRIQAFSRHFRKKTQFMGKSPQNSQDKSQ